MSLIKIKQEIFKKSRLGIIELDLLIACCINKSREYIITHPDIDLSAKQIKLIRKKWEERMSGVPLAYLLGYQEFYGLNFIVNKNVLIPRPETEIIIDRVLELKKKCDAKKYYFYDIGTGSGCIITALAKIFGKTNKYYASDISARALSIAKKNAARHKVSRIINYKKGHLFSPFLNCLNNSGGLTIVIANLPYLTKKQFDRSPSIQFEPKISLVCGEKGLALYFGLIRQLANAKNKKFYLFCEINPAQYPALKKFAQKCLPESKVSCLKDYNGRKRAAQIINA
jgi:release factor glutamine methyltransferase